MVYFSDLSNFHIWLIIFVIFLILEMFLGDLMMFSLSFGSLIGIISSYFKFELWIQITLASIFGILSIFFLRPFIKKWMSNKENMQSNVNAMIGQKVKVLEEINNEKGTGRISYFGDRFPAISTNGYTIKEGEIVMIEKIESIKVYVKQIKSK